MPKLGLKTTKRLVLPSSTPEDEAYVEVVDKLLLGAVAEISKEDDQIEKTIAGITHFIKDWNFTDDEGKKVPVTADNVKLLDMADFQFLASEFEKAMTSAEQGLNKQENLASTASSTEADNSTPTSTSQQITITTGS